MTDHQPEAHPPLGSACAAQPAQSGRAGIGRISGLALVGDVHLSNGIVGTASGWRLALTGVLLPLGFAFSHVFAFLLVAVIQRIADRPLIALWLLKPYDVAISVYEVPLWQTLLDAILLLGVLVALRFTPLSAYHAAEHKVVHAIERFGYVTWELARRMPRVHARCGTSLVAPILLFFILWRALSAFGWVACVAAFVVLWTLRLPLGGLMQGLATTKEPTDKQLRAGLEAGRKLVHLTRLDPRAPVPPLRRLWNRGVPQFAAGLAVGFTLLWQLGESQWFRLLDW